MQNALAYEDFQIGLQQQLRPGLQRQVQIQPILDDGSVSRNHFIMDGLDNTTVPPFKLEIKRTLENPLELLTAPQSRGYPPFARNGGIIRGTGEYVPPGPVSVQGVFHHEVIKY